ncbi:MAG: L-lactate dehydrogenase [Steroidobacteraceae bacterium]
MDGSSVDVTIDASNRPAPRIPRVAIIGPGLVGATTAYALLMSGVAGELVLIGRDRERVEGHVKDLSDAALYSRPTRIIAGDFGHCATADVIIVAVGVAQRRFAGSRLDDLKSSAAMVKHVMTDITRQVPTGVVVIATNPVDVLTYAAWKWSGLPAGRVIGSGTILDSSRFRRRVGERYGIATENVHAYVVGEHGDSQVALLSSARIGGTPLQELNHDHYPPYEEQALRRIVDSARRGGQDIMQAKGGTNYGISAALTRIAMAIVRDERAVLTVSTAVPEAMGLGQVSLSVPAIIGREGVQRVLPIRLSDEEDRALRRSAHILERHIATLDLSVEGSIPVNHSRASSSVSCANTSSWT